MKTSLLKIISRFTWKEWLVVGLLVAATFTRLWNLPQTLQFLGDQGRDALMVAKIFKEWDPVFIGPVTSVGNMYLGPFYYYFMLPFLWLTYPSPLGPAYAVAVASIFTVWLIYHWGRQMVGDNAALLAATLFTFSATVVEYSRFSWNPNLTPLLSLAVTYFTFMAWTKDVRYWIGAIVAFSLLMQLHYLALLMAGGMGLVWMLQAYGLWPDWVRLKHLVVATGVGALILLLTLTPLVLFDYKHGWLNANAFSNLLVKEENFYATDQSDRLARILTPIKETHGRSMHIFFEFSLGQQRKLNTALVLILAVSSLYFISQRKRRQTIHGEVVLMLFLAVGIIGTSFYQHTIFDHYIAFLFPLSFLLIGSVLHFLSQKVPLGKIIPIIFLGYFLAYNLPKLPLATPGWTIYDMQRTADTILERVEPGEKYNLVLLSHTGDIDGQNYRYFLSTTDRPPVAEAQRGEVETLFIINEDRVLKRVVDSPIYEIVVFPNKEPSEVYTVSDGPEITVLRIKMVDESAQNESRQIE
jgi:4-amino-4-deoxy-L-arabinose transferase-like glycosyltransferase